MLALLAATPLRGDTAARVFRIGILSNVPLSEDDGAWKAFMQGLRDLGYVEGQNLAIEHRSSEGNYQRLPALAAELVRLKVDVIVAPATHNVAVVRQATQTIPIVMTGAGDPVGAGLIASLARPGGNITGLSMLSIDIIGKQIGLLREIFPHVSRIAIVGNATNPVYPRWRDQAAGAAKSIGLSVQSAAIRKPDDFERVFATMAKEGSAAFVMPDGMFLLHRTRIVALAEKHRVPAMYGHREIVEPGGLLAYGPSLHESFRRAATYVDKILKGAKPADLPVEQPTKLDLIINLKTAKALGLTIPPAVLARADEIVE
jgi:putative tryptophan/tyrosine transport system substrate-binding protein